MDILTNSFGILKSHEPIELFSKYVENIFDTNVDILLTYNFIRNHNVSSSPDKIQYLRKKMFDYIEKKLILINSSSTCLMTLHDINNKLLRIRMLFSYLINRKSQDIFVDFLKDYYEIILKNINIFVVHVFTQLVDKLTPHYILKQAEESFDILVNGLNYHYEIAGTNAKISEDEKKKLIADSLLLHNKYGVSIIEEFGYVIEFYFKSFKTQKFNDLVLDFKLGEYMCKYESKIVHHIQEANIEYKYKFKTLISKLPIIPILTSVNVFVCDPIYYQIVESLLTNVPNQDIEIYLEKLICGLEANIIITKQKYASEQLFIDIAKTFKALSKMLDSWSKINVNVKIWIVQTINNILGQDDILINYLVTSMIIFVKKISSNNFQALKELVSDVAKCISVSNKETQFLDLFNQNLQTNIIKSKITEELFEYISAIIDNFDSNESNYIKIKKFLNEIEINVCYNSEVNNVKINSNKEIPISMELSNTILINKDVWKAKSNSKFMKIKLPDIIGAYFKVYEQFYIKKHSFRSIEWCYENSTIDIQINQSLITGPIIPISILVLISEVSQGISKEELVSKLQIDPSEISLLDPILNLLVSNGVAKFQSNLYTIESDLSPIINLNKLAVSKQKQLVKQEHGFDIANTTDCWIIKTLKPLDGKGLGLEEMINQINKSNKYFQIDLTYLKTRLDILIKKTHVGVKNSLYYYDT